MNKKIIHLIPSLGQGGAEKMLLKIIDNNRDDNIQHIVISSTKCSSQEHIYNINFSTFLGFWELLKLIKLEKPDVVIGWLYLANLVTSILSVIYTSNNTRYYHNFRNVIDNTNPLNIKRKIFLRFIKVVTKIKKIGCIYNSDMGLKSYGQYFEGCIFNAVIPNGFDLEDKAIVENEVFSAISKDFDLIVSFPARYDIAKNHDFFVLVVDKIIAENPHIKIAAILCGRGIKEQYHYVLEEMNIKNKEAFFLFESFDNLSHLYSISDLVFITSKTEAFPNVVGEAMSNKCFVISSDVGDCAKILGGKDWVYPSCNEHEALQLINKYLSLPSQEVKSVTEINYQRVISNYSIYNIVKRYNCL